jgi:hypothetical protein
VAIADKVPPALMRLRYWKAFMLWPPGEFSPRCVSARRRRQTTTTGVIYERAARIRAEVTAALLDTGLAVSRASGYDQTPE